MSISFIRLISLIVIIGLTAGDSYDCQFYRGTREGVAKPVGICEYDGQINNGVVEGSTSTIAECTTTETLQITTYDTMNCNGNIISQTTYQLNGEMEYNCYSLYQCNYVFIDDNINSGFAASACIESTTPVSRQAIVPDICSTKYYKDSGIKIVGSEIYSCEIDPTTGMEFMEIFKYAAGNNYCDPTQTEDVYACTPLGLEFRGVNELRTNYNPADDHCITDGSGSIGERYTVVRCDPTATEPPTTANPTANPTATPTASPAELPGGKSGVVQTICGTSDNCNSTDDPCDCEASKECIEIEINAETGWLCIDENLLNGASMLNWKGLMVIVMACWCTCF